MTDLIAYAYAVTVAIGGIVGYIKKGSMMSAIMVSTFLCIMTYCEVFLIIKTSICNFN